MADLNSGLNNLPYALLGGSLFSSLFNPKPYSNPADAGMPYLDQIQSTIQPLYQPYMDTGLNAMGQYYNNASSWATPQGASDNYNAIAGGYQQSPYAQYQNQSMQQAEAQSAAASGMAGTPSQQLAVANQTNMINSRDMNNYINSILGIQQQGQSGLGDLTHLGASQTDDYVSNIVKALMAQSGMKYMGQMSQNMHDAQPSMLDTLTFGII